MTRRSGGVIRVGHIGALRGKVGLLVCLLIASSGIAVAAATPAFAGAAPGTSPWLWQNPHPVGNDLGDISCPGVNVCFATGVPGAVLATANGGASWWTRPVPGGVGAISCPTTLVCFGGSSNNTLVHTTDGGRTWSEQTSPINASPPLVVGFGGISCASVSTCVAVGGVGSAHPGPGFIIATTDAGATWVDQTPGQIAPLGSVACPNSVTCYAAGQFGELLATKDGHSWTGQSTTVNNDLAQVSCATASVCAVAGPGNQVMTTANGGTTWVVHTTAVSASGGLTGMACPTVSMCIATGMDNHTTPDMIAVASSDSGTTWQSSYDPRIPGWLNRITCGSSTSCVAVGNHGWIATTSNGGSSWFSPSSGTSTPLHAVSCPSVQVCYASGDSGTVLSTTNGGNRWDEKTSSTTASLRGISCADTTHCVAVGLGGAITSTADGSATWTNVVSGTTQDLFAVSCPTVNHCVAVGQFFTEVIIDTGAPPLTQHLVDPYTVYGVNCPTPTSCFLVGSNEPIAVNGQLQNYAWISASTDGGKTWASEVSYDPNDLLAISCSANTTACSAVDNFGNMVTSTDGVNWSLHTIWTGGYPRLDAVSCPSPGACLAVGLAGKMVSTPDGGISAQPQPALTGHELFGASCPTTAVCTVVGESGVILSSGRPVPGDCGTDSRRGGILCRQPVLSSFGSNVATHVAPHVTPATGVSRKTTSSSPVTPPSSSTARAVDPPPQISAMRTAAASILSRLEAFISG